MRVQITTNAKGFNSRTIPLLEEYIDDLTENISISILGSTQEEVMTNMKVDLSRTMKTLAELSDKKSILVKKIDVSLRIIEGTQQEREPCGSRSETEKAWLFPSHQVRLDS